MMKRTLLLIPFLLVLFVSCNTTKMLTSGVKAGEVTDLQLMEPLGFVALIQQGSEPVHNDSLSRIGSLMLDEILSKQSLLPVTGRIDFSNDWLRHQVKNEVLELCARIEKQKTLDNVVLGSTVDSLLEASGKRFGLFVLLQGVTRTNRNYANQSLKGGMIGLLTLGLYMPIPIKAQTRVLALVVDAEKNDVAFFRSTVFKNKEPLDIEVLKSDVGDLFEKYFWVTK